MQIARTHPTRYGRLSTNLFGDPNYLKISAFLKFSCCISSMLPARI